MARYRTIKPEFWTSEQVVDCSPTARLLFVGLWNFCDDSGIHPYAPKQIKMEIFPGDDFTIENIESMLGELISNGLINTYHIDNKRYLIVTGWKHQKIEKPTYKHPKPIDFDNPSPTNRRLIDDPSVTEKSRVESSRVEKSRGERECEGKGVERESGVLQEPVHNSPGNGNGQRGAFLKNLKETFSRVQLKFPSPVDQRQVMLFIESNTKNHHGAVQHCLESLLKSAEVRNIRAYLDAAMKIESGKYNAMDNEARCNEFKKPPPGFSSFAEILKGMVKQ